MKRSCSWCHEMNDAGEVFCRGCGHMAHVSRSECSCRSCAGEPPRPKYPPGTQYVGFLFDAEGYHTPGTPLFSVQDAYRYVVDNWRSSHEVRITEPDEEATVLLATAGVLVYPTPDGTLKNLPCEGVERAYRLMEANA